MKKMSMCLAGLLLIVNGCAHSPPIGNMWKKEVGVIIFYLHKDKPTKREISSSEFGGKNMVITAANLGGFKTRYMSRVDHFVMPARYLLVIFPHSAKKSFLFILKTNKNAFERTMTKSQSEDLFNFYRKAFAYLKNISREI